MATGREKTRCLGATKFLWQETIPREERQTNQGPPSREKIKVENNGILIFLQCGVSCQLLIFLVVLLFFIYSVPEDAMDIINIEY